MVPASRRQVGLAFTLIELLTVIAIIAVLTALGLAGLSKAKGRAQSIVCQNNLRQLTFAWTAYALDNGDRLAYNLGGDAVKKAAIRNLADNWVENVMDWELSPDNTNRAMLSRGKLSPHLGSSTDVYSCPADRALSDLQRSAGWSRRVRSISMNAMTGDAGEASPAGTNVFNPEYKQFKRMSEIPRPSEIFVMLDEHPDSISDGYFLIRMEELEWVHLPASYHNGAGSLSFADGHTESHRWLNPSTRPPARPDAAPLPFAPPASERADIEWLEERMSIDSH